MDRTHRTRMARVRLALGAALLLSLSACATDPYRFGPGRESVHTLELAADEPQIERGSDNALLDGLGNLLSIPSKLILWNHRVDNHSISEETEASIARYLADNDLDHVKVRLNQYDPIDEWRRLARNGDVSPLWRFTVGALTVLLDTLLPGRLFGGDRFNPFTNSIHLYSDIPAVALHEAGHAKDFAGKRFKGTEAVLRMLPIVPLIQEAAATGDAIGYTRVRGSAEDEKAAYKILYPAYGTYVAGEALRFIPSGPSWLPYAVQGAVVIPGHLIGRIKAARVDRSGLPPSSPQPPLAPSPPIAPLGASQPVGPMTPIP